MDHHLADGLDPPTFRKGFPPVRSSVVKRTSVSASNPPFRRKAPGGAKHHERPNALTNRIDGVS
jgi:hypothetical protein